MVCADVDLLVEVRAGAGELGVALVVGADHVVADVQVGRRRDRTAVDQRHRPAERVAVDEELHVAGRGAGTRSVDRERQP